jgi:glycine oxidase
MKRYDAVIAGGGLIGASIALELARAGLKVGLFDAREPGQEASWASAGIISPAPESPGMIPLVPICKASAALYPEFVQVVEEMSGEVVGYRAKGSLEIVLRGDAQEEVSTVIAVHHGVGLKADALTGEQARELEPSLTEEVQAAILRPDEASVDNRALTQATLKGARRESAQIFAGDGAAALWLEEGRCKGLLLAGDRVEAGWTIIAAGCFSSRIRGVERYAPVFPTKGQMLALRCEAVKLERVLWAEKVYLVPRNDGRVLVGATIEHVGFDRRITAGGIRKLLSAAIELIPEFEGAHIEETWAGLRPDSPDHLPILGPTDLDGLLIATGHFRSGILLAPVTAKLIQEWICSQNLTVDWERFSPLRFLEAHKTQTAPG